MKEIEKGLERLTNSISDEQRIAIIKQTIDSLDFNELFKVELEMIGDGTIWYQITGTEAFSLVLDAVDIVLNEDARECDA